VEWAVDIFREARTKGLATAVCLERQWNTARSSNICDRTSMPIKVDLKSFDDRHYRELGGRLQPILDTIEWLHRAGVWVEVVTLLVPGFNDGEAELTGLTEFVASVSPDIPWHVTAFIRITG
jgi:pyruvate formate lyase activating enzyme